MIRGRCGGARHARVTRAPGQGFFGGFGFWVLA